MDKSLTQWKGINDQPERDRWSACASPSNESIDYVGAKIVPEWVLNVPAG